MKRKKRADLLLRWYSNTQGIFLHGTVLAPGVLAGAVLLQGQCRFVGIVARRAVAGRWVS